MNRLEKIRNHQPRVKVIYLTLTLVLAGLSFSACSTVSSVFATNQKKSDGPISNPFEGYSAGTAAENGTTFKTRRGNQSFEVSFPDQSNKLDEVAMPTRSLSADERLPAEDTYRNRKPAMADREIAETFPKTSGDYENDRADIEKTLGVMASADDTPRADKSYLAGMDKIKSLYKEARYEASLLEVEDLLIDFPTAPKLYEMRGTLLDRMGRSELAFRSWEQALKLDPKNLALKKYLERKRVTRGLASKPEEARGTQ